MIFNSSINNLNDLVNNYQNLLICICATNRYNDVWEAQIRRQFKTYQKLDVAFIHINNIEKGSIYPKIIFYKNKKQMFKSCGYLKINYLSNNVSQLLKVS